jgi:hypothetical protein
MAAMTMFRRPRRKVSRLSLRWQVMFPQVKSVSVILRLTKRQVLSPDVRKVKNLIPFVEREHIEYRHDSIKKSVTSAPVLKTVPYNPVRNPHTFATMIKRFGSLSDVLMNKPEISRTDIDGGPVSKVQTRISNLISELNA